MNIRAQIFGAAGAAEEPLLKRKTPKGAKPDVLHSIKVPRETRRLSNSRAGDRHRLTGERARVTFEGTDFEVELVNLSGGGAMVAGPFEPLIWDRVTLHLGDHGTIECAVRWVRDGRVGLEFAHETRLECGPDKVATLLRNVISRSFPGVRFAESAEPEVEVEVEPQAAADEHRVDPRHPLIWNGELHHDYQTSRVRIRNISGTGAMIQSETPVRVGAEPMLQLGEDLMIPATVVWATGDQVGLHFQSEFDMHQLAGVKPVVTGSTWSPPTYIQKAGVETSPWDPHWKRMGLKQLQRELEGYLKH
jgi:hypothetical protein